jgi:hypothetical protein
MRPKSTLDRAERTLICDLKTEVDFRLPRGADFEMCYSSQLCATLSGFEMQKNEKHFRKAKSNKKNRENE